MTNAKAAATFPASKLKFFEKSHRYTLDGKPVKGVTTLLSGGLPKPALPYWAAKSVAEWVATNGPEAVALLGYNHDTGECEGDPRQIIAELKAKPWEKRDAAAVRGTDVHDLAERIVHGQEVDVPDHLTGYVAGYLAFVEEYQLVPRYTEKPVASRRWGYAGKFDFIGQVKALGDETYLLDWKTSSGVYGETALQCAAYANAEFLVDNDLEIPMPAIDRIGVVHITETGTTLHDLGSIEEAFKIFTHVQYTAKRTDDIKTFVGPAITLPEGIAS